MWVRSCVCVRVRHSLVEQLGTDWYNKLHAGIHVCLSFCLSDSLDGAFINQAPMG